MIASQKSVYFPIVCIILILQQASTANIPEPLDYGPKSIPNNVSTARQALNYDKYASQPVQSSKVSSAQKFPYGNNWEQFDTPEIHYNFGYKSGR